MKKLLLVAGVVGAIAFYLNKKTAEPQNELEESFFDTYNNKILVNPSGIWMVVVDGVIYTFTDAETLNRWQSDNPQDATPIRLDFDAWGQYATQQVNGVSNLPRY